MRDHPQRLVLIRTQPRWQVAPSEVGHSGAPSQSRQLLAVNGSLTPGDSARAAISTSSSIRKRRSWSAVRRDPTAKALRSVLAHHFLVAAVGRPRLQQHAAFVREITRLILQPDHQIMIARDIEQRALVDQLEIASVLGPDRHPPFMVCLTGIAAEDRRYARIVGTLLQWLANEHRETFCRSPRSADRRSARSRC